jgi:sugar lactone lactonase YvrE
VVNAADQLGETPLWCERTGKLWWLHIERPRLQSFDPSSGIHDVFPFKGVHLGSLAFHESGGFLVMVDNELFRLPVYHKAYRKYLSKAVAGVFTAPRTIS